MATCKSIVIGSLARGRLRISELPHRGGLHVEVQELAGSAPEDATILTHEIEILSEDVPELKKFLDRVELRNMNLPAI